MLPIVIREFGGVAPKVDPHNLAPTLGQSAVNARLTSGALSSWRKPLKIVTPTKVGTKLSIYRIHLAGVDYWLHWTTDVNVVKSPISQDTFNRYYYTGDSEPRVTTPALATTAGTDYPVAWYSLGIPTPVLTPTDSVAGGGGATVSRTYVFTYVSAWGEEGSASPPSAVLSGFVNGTWNIAGMGTTPPAGTYQITSKNVYRTVTGTTGVTSYFLVANIPIGTATYADTTLDAALITVLPSLTWVPPNAAMTGLTAFPGGVLIGFFGNTLCFSEPYRPHAWPIQYQISLDYNIVGVGVSGSTIVVTTAGSPYLVTGTTPASMNAVKSELFQPCLSKRSIVDVGNGVKYACPDGVAFIGIGVGEISTRDLIAPYQWITNFFPSTLVSAAFQGRYYGIYQVGTIGGVEVGAGFTLGDGATNGLGQIAELYTALWVDPLTGLLYAVLNGDIVQWDGDTANMASYDWRSKYYLNTKPGNYGAIKIDANYAALTTGFSAAAAQAMRDLATNTALIAAEKVRGKLGTHMLGEVTLGGSAMVGAGNSASFTTPFLTAQVYANGSLVWTHSMTSNAPVRLPSGFKHDGWEFRLSGNIDVYKIGAGETIRTLERL